MLNDFGVAFTPGNDFGVHTLGATSYVRFTYTETIDRLERLLWSVLAEGVQTIKREGA